MIVKEINNNFNNYLLIILFLLIFNINKNNAATPQAEFDCMKTFLPLPIGNKWIEPYNFCSGASSCHTNGSIKAITLEKATSNEQPFILYAQNFSCLPYLLEININNIKVDPSFIYSQYFPPYFTKLKIYQFQNTPEGIIQPVAKMTDFFLSGGIGENTVLYLSYLSKVDFVFFSGITFYLIADKPDIDVRFKQFTAGALNLPDMTNYQNDYLTLSFDNTFPLGGAISNFSTISATTCVMNHLNVQPFYAHFGHNIKQFTHIGLLDKPIDYISLKTNTNYTSLRFYTFGENFHIDGNFPLKDVPKTTTITFEKGNIPNIPPLSLLGDSLNAVTFKDCKIQTGLGVYTGTGALKFDLSNNKITGTIDESWCTTNLIVSNNSMTGEIPSCFACYFNDTRVSTGGPAMFERFSDNSFSNYNKNYVCTSFAPKSDVIDINTSKIRIYGTDIGTNTYNWLDRTSTIQVSNIVTNTVGKDYTITLTSQKLNLVQYYQINFTLPYGLIYTFPVTKKPPVATSIIVDTNGKSFTIVGSFFSTYFGYIPQSVNIEGNVCTAATSHAITNFFKIQCTTSAQIPGAQDGKSQMITITTDSLSKKYLIKTYGASVNDKPCSNNCTSDSNGYCDLSTGQCVCNEPWSGSNCDQIQCDVPNCNSHGTCNLLNGTCQCFNGYFGNDCEQIQCTVPDCSSHGNCNYTTGKCECSQGYFGVGCEQIQCAIPNCNLNGTCDTTTGKCQCFDGYFGNGCEQKQCTIPDCSSHGNCNTNTGTCQCFDGYFGNGCEQKQCLVPDCSSHGTCNTTNGTCQCNNGYFGNDCEQKQCSVPDCNSHGICNTTNGTCQCSQGYFGNDCEQIQCTVPDCNSHGICNYTTGKCECSQGYFGIGCEQKQCSVPNCSLNGNCDTTTGTCQCFDGYFGNGCEQKQCTIPDCSSHGNCNYTTGKCECTQGYLGNGCEQIQCPVPDCSSHGTCNTTNGTCQCSEGYFGNGCEQIQCSVPDCSSHGNCNTNTGSCECLQGYFGIGCEQKQCSVPDCSSHGTCNTTNGVCQCSQGYFGESCNQMQCIDPDCNSQGKCNYNIGKCVCSINYSGDNCTIPIHFITSINSSTTLGGLALFQGFFGDIHKDLYITIGGNDCPIIFNSSSTISCYAPSGSGIQNYIVYQNGITRNGKYEYKEITYRCKNDCSGNGNCDTSSGSCSCYPGYNDFDCSNPIVTPSTTNGGSSPSNPSTNTSIDGSTGGTNISNQEIIFEIYFSSLLEIDINGNIVRNYSLKNNWILNTSTTTDNNNNNNNSPDKQYQFIQHIQDDKQCTIVSTIDEILSENGKDYSFADTTFKLESGSIKFSISIYNYSYSSNLNTLRLDLISLVDKDLSKGNGCNEEQTAIYTNDNGDLVTSSNFNYIKISKNNKVLTGRFINKVVSDGRSTYLSTNINRNPDNQESIIVSLNLPHAMHSIQVDPDFSVLIAPDFKNDCETSSKNNWLIPVAVAVPVGGAAAIASVSFFVYKKKKEIELLSKLKQIRKNN